jgi:hypothetical protein
VKSLALVLAIYWIPLAAHAAFWLTARLPFPSSLGARLYGITLSMAGPFLFFLAFSSSPVVTQPAPFVVAAATMFGPLLWLAWSVALWRTRVRNMPYAVHVTIALVWILAGCIPLGISV